MAKPRPVKYEDVLREYLKALRGEHVTRGAVEFGGFAAATAEQVADAVATLREIAARDWYPHGWHVSRGGGNRLSIHDMKEFPDDELRHDEHCPGCLAEKALAALDREAQP